MRLKRQIRHGLLLAVLLLATLAVVAHGDTFLTSSPRAAFAPRRVQGNQQHQLVTQLQNSVLLTRGGATVVADEEDSDEEEEEESDEEEEEEEDEVMAVEEDSDEEEEEEESSALDASLAAAAVKSTQKAKSKAQSSKSSTVKKTMSAKLSKPKKKSGSLLKFLRVPYIVRACLNPFTIMSMTKHFWLSLVNLDYPPKDVSQDLRSALDDKARKGGPTQARGKRKMKRGQAKTLSDLPKLST